MSTTTRRLPFVGTVDTARLLATASVALVMLSYLSVLYFVATVVGDRTLLVGVVAAALAAATLTARLLRPRYAVLLTLAMVGAGAAHYLGTLPETVEVYGTLGPLIGDSVSMLSGLSILRIVNAGTWALAIAPAPTFLAWYLALRHRYVAGAAVAGATLGIFVLTGNADAPTTLLGAVGVAGAMGFGDIARRDRERERAEADPADDAPTVVDERRRSVLLELGAIVAVASAVDVVPDHSGGRGGRNPLTTLAGDGTVEANLLNASDNVQLRGSISLSPKVRFTVTSNRSGYWRVGSFDRYTGQGWVRTGGSEPYEGRLPSPAGRSRRAEQTYTTESRMGTMPALWKPTTIAESATAADVLDSGSLRPVRPFAKGETYTVVSRTPVIEPEDLRGTGTDYPTTIEELYTALPDSMPERVGRRTERIAANATNPYDTARVIERWLRNNRDYSLDVEKPDGDVTDAFLFRMDAGYCTYFATTMATMLRTQGIPARFVVGYTPGEQVAEDRWVARGLNAHAWVEVHFEDHGWIQFDPTPAGPRQSARTRRLANARSNGEPNVDTSETGTDGATPTPEPNDGTSPTPDDGGTTPDIRRRLSPDAGNSTPTPAGGQPGFNPTKSTAGESSGIKLPELPPGQRLGLGLVVALGAAAGLRQSGVGERAYREVWLRYQPRTDPVSDTRRAFERVEYLLGRTERPRRTGETVRQYAAAVGDERARRVATLYERATYAGDIDEALADEAVRLADELVGEGGFGRRKRQENRGV